jgi:hypothetical protein
MAKFPEHSKLTKCWVDFNHDTERNRQSFGKMDFSDYGEDIKLFFSKYNKPASKIQKRLVEFQRLENIQISSLYISEISKKHNVKI